MTLLKMISPMFSNNSTKNQIWPNKNKLTNPHKRNKLELTGEHLNLSRYLSVKMTQYSQGKIKSNIKKVAKSKKSKNIKKANKSKKITRVKYERNLKELIL